MRSAALALAVILLTGTAQAAPSTAGRTEFEVLRNGQPFGRHTISVTRTSDGFSVQARATLRVGAGPVTLYLYQQTCEETWSAGVLSGLSCSTLRDGRRMRVTAQRSGGELRVSGLRGEASFPLGALPTSWWIKPALTTASMINTEDGAPMPIRVTRIGRETIATSAGSIAAERIRVIGTMPVDLWYDDSGRWVGCAFSAHGQHITYRLVTPPDGAPA